MGDGVNARPIYGMRANAAVAILFMSASDSMERCSRRYFCMRRRVCLAVKDVSQDSENGDATELHRSRSSLGRKTGYTLA